jgi:hypothetical protein
MNTWEKIIMGGVFSAFTIIMLAGAAIGLSACGNLPQTPYIVEEETVWEDGSVSLPGEQPYVDGKGKGTAHKIDPETGEENRGATVYDEDEIKKKTGEAKAVAEQAPEPFGKIGATILGVIGSGVLAWAAYKNRKKIKKLGGKKAKKE